MIVRQLHGLRFRMSVVSARNPGILTLEGISVALWRSIGSYLRFDRTVLQPSVAHTRTAP